MDHSLNEAHPYLTEKEVAVHFNVSPDSIRRWIRQGKFPKPLRIGTGTSRWRRKDIEAYEATLSAADLCEEIEMPSTFFNLCVAA